MSLSDIASVAQVFASIIVFLSLPPLIISVRQNTRSQRAMVVDSLAGAIAAINTPATESPHLGRALQQVLVDWYSADQDQRIIAHYFLFSYFKLHENAFYQNQAGILENEQWNGWQQSALKYFHSPGIQSVWWPNRRQAYSRPFQEFLENSSPPELLGNLADIFEDSSGGKHSVKLTSNSTLDEG